MWDLDERASPVTDKVDILLTAQQAQSAQLSQLLSLTGGHGARLEALQDGLSGLSTEMVQIRRHVSECPARAGYDTVRVKLEALEKRTDKRTPKNGLQLPDPKSAGGIARLILYVVAGIVALVGAILGVNL